MVEANVDVLRTDAASACLVDDALGLRDAACAMASLGLRPVMWMRGADALLSGLARARAMAAERAVRAWSSVWNLVRGGLIKD